MIGITNYEISTDIYTYIQHKFDDK